MPAISTFANHPRFSLLLSGLQMHDFSQQAFPQDAPLPFRTFPTSELHSGNFRILRTRILTLKSVIDDDLAVRRRFLVFANCHCIDLAHPAGLVFLVGNDDAERPLAYR